MANELIEYLQGRSPGKFQPHPFYSKEGDFLTYFFRDEDHYAERIDDILTVYHSMETEEFVGFKLKGVAHLIKTLGDLCVQVFDCGELMLSMLLMAGSMKTNDPSSLRYYQKAAFRTKQVRLKKEEFQIA